MAHTDMTALALAGARACPFAAPDDGDKHELQIIGEPEFGTMYVVCACGARSPFGRQPIEVVARWNKRYADIMLSDAQRDAGRGLIIAQRRIDEVEAKFSAMQVENNALLERARTAEAALELTTKLAEVAAREHGDMPR